MNGLPTFIEWMNFQEGQNQTANKIKGGKKCSDKLEKSPGVRNHEDDLDDYKGHMAHNGDVEPFKVQKKNGKAVAPIAK